MTTTIYKAQAARLVAHLGERHGVKLKHASALEAVAALHGARDWNTLIAAGQPRLEREAPDSLCLSSVKAQSAAALSFAWDAPSTEPLMLEDALLRQHLAICGHPGSGTSTSLRRLVQAHVARGGAFLHLSAQASGQAPDAYRGLSCDGRALQVHSCHVGAQTSLLPANLLEGGNISLCSERILALLPLARGSVGGEYYRERARMWLHLVLGAHAALGRTLSVQELLRAFQSEELLPQLLQALPQDSPAHAPLQSAMSALMRKTKNGPQFDAEALARDLGGLCGRLHLLVGLPTTCSANPRALRFDDLMRTRESGYVEVDTMAADMGEAAARRVMVELAAAIASSPPAAAQDLPYLVVLSGMARHASTNWGVMLARAQAAGVALVFQEQFFHLLCDGDAPVAPHVATHVVCGPVRPKDVAALLEHGLAVGEVSAVGALEAGDALLMGSSVSRRVRLLAE